MKVLPMAFIEAKKGSIADWKIIPSQNLEPSPQHKAKEHSMDCLKLPHHSPDHKKSESNPGSEKHLGDFHE
jgi:hypothetical protein